MAGVKGKCGGPRANSGGARPGAGRPKKQPAVIPDGVDMLALLKDIALGRVEATALQVRAAAAAVQYTHAKMGEGGKKDQAADAAKKAASKFAATPAPLKLVKSA